MQYRKEIIQDLQPVIHVLIGLFFGLLFSLLIPATFDKSYLVPICAFFITIFWSLSWNNKN